MSHDREECSHASQQIPSGKKGASKRNRSHPLERIENQRQYAQCRRRARDIGRPDIAAACLPDVLPAKNAHQNKTERNRSQQDS